VTHLKATSVTDYAQKAFDERVEKKLQEGKTALEAVIEREEHYPMCAKLSAVRNDRAVIQCFLEWLEENDLAICLRLADGRRHRISRSKDQLLMEYFGIDEKKLEEERRKILNEQRKLNKEKP